MVSYPRNYFSSHSRSKKIFFETFIFCLISFVLMAPSVFAEGKTTEFDREIKSKSGELKKIEDDLRRKKLARDEERRKEEAVRKELKRIEAALSDLAVRRQQIKKKIRQAQKLLDISQRSLLTAVDEVDRTSKELRRSFNIMYLESVRYNLYYPSGHLDFFKKCDILDYARRTFERSCQKRSVCEMDVSRWRSASASLAALENQLAENLKEQSQVKEEKNRLLTDATARRISLEEEIKGLSETSKALQDMIADLETRKKKKLTEEKEKAAAAREKQSAPSRFKGQLLRPIAGEVVVHFGKNKRSSSPDETVVISNGIKIKPASGTRDVIASASGEVIFSGAFRSYGQMVVVDHGGTLYTVYGLLEDISVSEGDDLREGQKIGSVGSNGSALLYYEVRYDGKPVDPLEWIKE